MINEWMKEGGGETEGFSALLSQERAMHAGGGEKTVGSLHINTM